jgi:hypothetical protein
MRGMEYAYAHISMAAISLLVLGRKFQNRNGRKDFRICGMGQCIHLSDVKFRVCGKFCGRQASILIAGLVANR